MAYIKSWKFDLLIVSDPEEGTANGVFVTLSPSITSSPKTVSFVPVKRLLGRVRLNCFSNMCVD